MHLSDPEEVSIYPTEVTVYSFPSEIHLRNASLHLTAKTKSLPPAIHYAYLHMTSRKDQLPPGIPTNTVRARQVHRLPLFHSRACKRLSTREPLLPEEEPELQTVPTMTATATAFPPHASICSLISFLSHHLAALLADPAALLATRRRCVKLLAGPSPRPASSADGDDDDDAVLAALQGAIDSFPSAAAADAPGDAGLLHDVEAALQAPALLPEDGRTAGRDNRLVAACAYFYLALVRAAQGDAWQMAAHFLQAVLVSPAALADGGLAPRALWDGLFDEAVLARAGGASEEDAARRAARRYKDWLMYYRVVAAAPDGAGAASANGGG